MASLRFIIAASSSSSGSRRSASSMILRAASPQQWQQAVVPLFQTARFSSSDNNGTGDNNNNDNAKNNNKKDQDDPFGVNFQDGTEHGKLGTDLPPKYKRDSMTGKFTGEQETEMTVSEKKLLRMDLLEEQDYIVQKVFKDWNLDADDDEDSQKKLSHLAQRIRRDSMALNTLGRSVEAQSSKETLDDGEDGFVDASGFSKPLSAAEFKVFQKHMADEYKTDISEDDIPTIDDHDDDDDGAILDSYADTEYLNTKWMSSKAVRFMDDTKEDDPFSDLLPSDLSPSNLVNRQKAKPIPKELLHHNNLALLRRYITPTGQIMNRVQSRLGAKDQRRIAKLIKRARALGLLPTAGQFVVEAHGSIHEKDINEDREWEKELRRRGLTVKNASN